MAQFLDVAILAAKKAGQVHKKYFNTDIEIKTKKDSFDLVTVADIDAEAVIVSVIREYFPDHNFWAEENKYEKTASEYTWIVDPLDGTNNFSCGLPIFCASIALAKGTEVIAGAVYDCSRDELFSAEKNSGAYLNEKRINVSRIDKLSQALLITGFYYDRGEKMLGNLERIKQFFLKDILGLRRLGAAALDLCYIGCGRASGFWEFELNVWDFAAAKLIIEEAGGKVSTKEGSGVSLEKSYVVASNGKIHDKMLEVLN